MYRRLFTCIVGLWAAACAVATESAPGATDTTLDWPELQQLVASRDYFTLRERFGQGHSDGVPVRYAGALLAHAFNRPAASNAEIGSLLGGGVLTDSMATELRRLQMSNHLRLFEYAPGLAVADAILADTAWLGPAALRDVRNMQRIFAALAAVPPQTVERRGATTVRLEQGRVLAEINDSSRHYVFDTGANLSTLMRSEAAALGLRILSAQIDVGTSTERRVVADLAVADQLRIGQVQFRNVVFLVLDDELLTFPGGVRIPGIIGFPVIEQLGEVHMLASGELFVPDPVPPRTERNLALHDLTPLIRVGWEDAVLLCRLDTGADATFLYEPAYRRYRNRIEGEAEPATHRWGGAGGIQELQGYRLPRMDLALGDTLAVVDSVAVLTTSIAREATENYLDCNLGQDVLGAFSGYILNFRDMAFLLR